MSTVYMHIGFPKTGTIYIQAMLRKNAAQLARHGVRYPVIDSRRTPDVAITSGNGSYLVAKQDYRRDFLRRQKRGKHLLVSSEQLSLEIIQTDGLEQFLVDIRKRGYSGLSILLLVRDPIELAASGYQQTIKRGGRDVAQESYFDQFDLRGMAQLIRKIEAVEGIELRIRNYRNWKTKLPEVMRDWLGLQLDFELPDTQKINRSLTASELNLQRMLNVRLGPSGKVLADRFCEDLPDIPAGVEFPPIGVQKRLAKRLEKSVSDINHRVPQGEELLFSFAENTRGPDGNRFSDAQLEIIAGAIASRELHLRQIDEESRRPDRWTKVLERKIRLSVRRLFTRYFAH